MKQERDIYSSDGEPRKEYSSQEFVGRTKQIGLYSDAVQNLIAVDTSVILNFWGIDGIGKTWLLRHLAASTEEILDEDLTSLRILDKLEEGELPYEIKTIDFSQVDKTKMFLEMQEKMESFDPKKKIILFIDNAHLCSSEVWSHIEAELLDPLLAKLSGTRKGVVVIAGNTPIPRWHKFEIRTLLHPVADTQLLPFNVSEIRDKTDKVAMDEISPVRLQLWSVGSPALLEMLLGKFYEELAVDGISRYEHTPSPELLAYLEKILTALTEDVRQNGLTVAFEAIAVLRQYSVEDLRLLFENKYPKLEKTNDIYFLNALRFLNNKTDIVTYTRSRYVTSPVVRRLREIVMEHTNPARLLEEHERAAQLYLQKAMDFAHPVQEILEYWYHLGRIATLSKKSPEWLNQESLQILTAAGDRLTNTELEYLRLEAPPLTKDPELFIGYSQLLESRFRAFIGEMQNKRQEDQELN